MTKLQLRALLYQMGCFGVLYLTSRYLIGHYTALTGLWVSITAFVIGTILVPQFQAIKTKDGEKLFMKWIFIKGVRIIG